MRRLVWLTAAAGLVVACGDEKNEGGGGSSAIDGKQVSELNAKELGSLCQWFVDLEAKSSITDKQFCTQDAADFAESAEECEELRDECLAEITTDEEASCDDFSVSKTCEIEVKALKKCITDLYKLYDDAARSASCDSYEDAIVDTLPASCDDLPPSCIEIQVSASFSGLRRR